MSDVCIAKYIAPFREFYFGTFWNITASVSGDTSVFMFLQEDFLFLDSLFKVHLKFRDKDFHLNSFITYIMEEICLRFPHLMEQINEELDDESLIECKIVSKMMCSIIQNQKRFLTITLIQGHVKHPFEKEWKMVLQKLPVKRLNKFITCVKDFHTAVSSNCLMPDTQYAVCSTTWLYRFLQTHCKSEHFKPTAEIISDKKAQAWFSMILYLKNKYVKEKRKSW